MNPKKNVTIMKIVTTLIKEDYMNIPILILITVAICIPLSLAYACLQVILQISKTIAHGDITIKLALELPAPTEYTAVPEQPTEADKKVMDVAQSIQAFFLDDAQMFKDTEVK